MRLRCPNKNCPINVPDALLGTTIRCPLCMALIVVDERDRDFTVEQFKPGDPSVTPESEAVKKEASDLENRIYDGLPPLSVMLALRKRQGANYDASDFARRYEMTDDDWKALDAFESVLYAVAALRISTVVTGAVFAMNAFFLYVTDETQLPIASTLHPALQLLLLLSMFVCVVVRYQGQVALSGIHLGWAYTLLLPITLAAMLVFGVEAWVFLRPVLFERSFDPRFLNFVGGIFNVLALLDLCRSGLVVMKALGQIRPPEISHRLSEALRYLE